MISTASSIQRPLKESRQPLPVEPRFVFLGALGYLALNFVHGPSSIIFGSALAAFIVWSARPEYLPALVILQTIRANFALTGYGTWDHDVQRFFDNAIIIAGFPISVNYVIAATVFLRIGHEFINRPQTFTRTGLKWLFIPWIIGLILAAIMTLQAFAIRNPSWTANIRTFMLIGCIFYGMILFRHWRVNGNWLFVWMVPLTGVLFWLAAFGRFHHQFLWIFTGLAIPLSWLAFRQQGLHFKCGGLFCALGALIYASGLGPGMAAVGERVDLAGGVMGTGSSSFTLNAMMALSIIVAGIAALPKSSFRRFISWFLGWPAFATIFTFSFAVAIASPYFTTHASIGWTASHADMTPVERFTSKLFDDRSIIWHGTLKDAMSGDYIFRAAASPIVIDHPRHGSVIWQPGAHNTFLEALRAHRWIGGPILMLFVLITMIRCAEVVGKPVPTSLRAVAAGIIAVSIIGNTTGSAPVSGDGAFWYFTFSGIVIAAIVESKARARAGGPSLVLNSAQRG